MKVKKIANSFFFNYLLIVLIMRPYCFVLMPFGRKSNGFVKSIDFDQVYNQIIKPAIIEAELEPIRADEEIKGGIIHKPMFERLMLCDYAIADLTTANPNVLYELGIRHGIRPHSTVLTFAKGMRLPFDVAPLRGLPYTLNWKGLPSQPKKDRKNLIEKLKDCRKPDIDSPLYQLVTDFVQPDISRLKTDKFRDLIEYSQDIKEKLETARNSGSEAISEIKKELKIIDTDPAIIIDLLLSFRAVSDWNEMVNLINEMPKELQESVLVQEQLGFALNRLGRHKKAEKVLSDIINDKGSSSETNGLLGRVYKDLWEKALKNGEPSKANGYLIKAIDTYLEGFETDWRDAYPGINAITLMEMRSEVDSRQEELIPVVQYAVNRRIDLKEADYWDYATQLELDIIKRERSAAKKSLSNALVNIREGWEPKTTARNIRLIRQARSSRMESVEWILEIEEELLSV